MPESFLGGRVILHAGDCLEVLAQLADNSVDSVVTDPPYHLTSIVKRFGSEDAAAPKVYGVAYPYGCNFKEENGGTGAAFARMSRGFMGKVWDGGTVAFEVATWRALIRVLKPGGHLVACGGTRTYHRMACAIEDAGFEIRDTISWLYGSGFPKSHDVSKGIDAKQHYGKANSVALRMRDGREPGTVGTNMHAHRSGANDVDGDVNAAPLQTDAARQWEGWGTALKPACELIVLARKPLSEGTVAANVLRWGTGAINVDGCRVEGVKDIPGSPRRAPQNATYGDLSNDPGTGTGWDRNVGRWPANVAHDGSAEVVAAFPETVNGGNLDCASIGSANQIYGQRPKELSAVYGRDTGSAARFFYTAKADAERGTRPGGFGNVGAEKGDPTPNGPTYLDKGSTARFFYTAKADADDRLGSKHPTVKPLDLMQWLVRMVTPPGGTVLDPFAGTGTTGEAAFRELASAVLIEAEPEYCEDIRRRMRLVLAGPDERTRQSIKAKGLPVDHGPLFAWGGAIEEAAE